MSNVINLVNAQPGDVIRPPLINLYSALSIAPYWRAVNFLVNNLSSFDRDVYQNDTSIDEGHPLDLFLERRPNQNQTANSFFRTVFFHQIHTGNGYAKIRRTASGSVGALYNMLPEHVTPFRLTEDGGDPLEAQQWYYYAPTKSVLPAADVIHLPGLGYDGMVGYDPIALMSPTFVQASSIQRYQTKYIQKGTVIRGQVNIPGGVPKEKAEELVNTVRAFFTGPEADRDVIVLSDGAVLNNSTLTPQQSQLIEWDRDITKKISQVTGVPPRYLYELGEQKYTDDAEENGEDLVRFVFRPLLDIIEDELTLKLLTFGEQDAGYRVRLDPTALLRGNTEASTANVVSLVTSGIIDANEARADLGKPPHKDAAATQLKTLGDTAPQKPQVPSAAAQETTNSQPKAADGYSALLPVLDAAIERVEAKAEKALANRETKPAAERTIWGNVFAQQQASYAVQELTPIASAIQSLGGKPFDLAVVEQRYAQEIRRRVAREGEVKGLREIVGGNNELHSND